MLETFGLVGKMAKGFWVKTSQTGNFKTITGFFVKVSPSTWQSVNDAWVKVKQTGSDAFKSFWQSATNPDSPIEILTSFTTTSELLRLQGKNYHWTPTPSTLFYTFSYVNNDTNITKTLTSSTSTSNPSTGSSITLPTSTTYRTISKSSSDDEYNIGGVSTYKFTVTGNTSTGAVSVQNAEYSMRTPKAPILSVERLSSTSVKITITAASGDDFAATYRYIVSTYDAVAGTIESGGGRGGYSATSDPTYVTLTGMTAGRLYYIYVTPFTGSAGSTEANATGYAGITANTTTQGEADYSFSFGNTLHVGTNGYVSLDTGSTSDSISGTTGRVIGVFPGDLYQDTTASVWYWSDSTRFVIRWEGYHYNQTSNLRQYEIVFSTSANYATVYAINVANTTEGTDAYVKAGVTKSSYPAALTTGAWRQVWFDGITTPSVMFGPYVPTSKSVMKQVVGLTSGTQDQGYTSIVTSTNQNVTPTLGAFNVSSFTKGTVGSSSQGATRSTTLSWGASTNATRYEIQYQGSNDEINWTTVQSYAASPYNTGTSETKNWSTSGGDFGYYTYMRANIRASESTATAEYVYSNSGSYVNASGTAPGQPSFNTILPSAVAASVPFTVGTTGTNYLYTSIEYQYRTQFGSYPGTWSTSVITNGAGTISLTGLSASTTYYIKIRTRNYDELYSPENETNFSTTSSVSISSVSYNGSGTFTVNVSGGGPYYQIFWNTSSGTPTGTYYDAAGTSTSISESLTPTAGYSYYFWARSSTQYIASTTQSGNGTSGTYTDYVGPYTIRLVSYDYNGGSGTTSLHVVSDGSYTTLPSPSSRTGYTFNGWYTSSSGGTYVGGGGSSYYVSSTLTLYAQWTADTYAVNYYSNTTDTVGSMPSAQTKTYNVSLTLSSNTPTRTDYTFNGWNTNSSGTGTNYAAGASYTTNAALDLYAKWGAAGPTAPTGLSVTAGTITSNLSTSLTRNSATNKTQSWTTATSQAVSISWTKGTGTATITSDVKWNQTGVTPASTDSGTWNGVSGSSQTDSNGGGTTNYYWVRTSDGNSVKSAWVFAGQYTATSPSMTGFSIRIYRGSGSGSTGFSSPTTAPSSTSTSGSNTYSGLVNRDASPDFGHYAWANGTLNGTAKTATSSTV